MIRHYLAGHFWLLISLVLFVGRKAERHSPEFDSFAGIGWMEPTTYHFLIVACLAVSALCFWQARPDRSRPAKVLDSIA